MHKPHHRLPWLRIYLATGLILVAGVVAGLAACRHAAVHAHDPNALWRIVHERCVPAARQGRIAKPCVEVSLKQGVQGGYVVMKDLRGKSQYLVLPTARISGIESPQLLRADAPNYLADAWSARSWVEKALGRTLPRGDIALAINSVQGRTQNQLHIHVDCIRGDVRKALDGMLPDIGGNWSRLPKPLAGHSYRAMRVDGPAPGVRPIQLLARSLRAGQSMGRQTLVMVGQRFTDGRHGFLLLAGQSDIARGNWGSGEELQDHRCRVANALPSRPQAQAAAAWR